MFDELSACDKIMAGYYSLMFLLPIEGNIETSGTDTPANTYYLTLVAEDRCGATATGTATVTITGSVSLY